MQKIKLTILILLCVLCVGKVFAVNDNFSYYFSAGEEEFDKYKSYYMNTNLDNAFYNFNKARELSPDNTDVQVYLSQIYSYKHQFNLAKSCMMNAINLNPLSPKVNFHAGEFYFNGGEFTKAIDYYKKAESCGYQQNMDNLIKMAISYEKLGDFKNAQKYLEKCSALDPQNPEVKIKIKKLQHANDFKKDFDTFKEQSFEDF